MFNISVTYEDQPDLQSQMLTAIEQGDVDAVKAVLTVHRAEKCFTNLDCDQCLLAACRHGNPHIVSALVRLGHIWSTDEDGSKPIHLAVQSGNLKTTQVVINSGASVMTRDKYGRFPLHYAAKYGFCDVIKFLLQEGASTTRSRLYETDETPQHLAARFGHLDAVSLLLKNHADVNAVMKNTEEPTCLHIAAKNEHADVVSHLCLQGADVTIVDEKNGNTPLHVACLTRSGEVARILLKYGANVTTKNKRGLTPLHVAVMNKSVTVVKVLLQSRDVDVLLTDCKGLTSLHYASLSLPEIMRVLLASKDVDVTALRSPHGLTCLHYAAATGNLEVVEMLLKAKHRVNVVDSTGFTPLHSAIVLMPRAAEVVQCLIQAGAVIDARSRNVTTPLHRFALQCIVGRLDEDILKLLATAGATLAPPDSKSRVQKSPLRLLTRYGRMDTIRYLVECGWSLQQEREWIELQFGNASTNEVLLYLREMLQRPRTLQESCRHAIRGHLSRCAEGTEVLTRIDGLHLPQPLKRFLKLQ